jgi:hypothetical protein
MRLPGFAAQSTLYKTRVHYKMAVESANATGSVSITRRQTAPPRFSTQVVPGVIGPFPNVLCEPCALDQSGECTRYCVHCPTPYPSEECWSSFTPCDDSECCQAGQNPCYVPGKSQFCCPSGQSCCDPETNFCCPNPGESCCNPATKFCCPSQQTPCCSAETNLCCAPGELCCDPGNLCCPAGNICCGGGCCPHQCCGGDTCTNLETDPLNCGLCTLVCPAGPANSTPTCVNGQCGWACNSGYTQCGNACCPSADGCCSGSCTPLNTTGNCGACGRVCPAGPASSIPVCINGECGWVCKSGYTRCGNACCPSGDGCCNGNCTPLNSTSNCGTCGKVCPAGPANSARTCTSGKCGWACNSGYTACDSGCCPSPPPPPPKCPGGAGCMCKAGGICDPGLVCVDGSTCYACGGTGELCCAGNTCKTGLTCQQLADGNVACYAPAGSFG